MQGTLPAPDRLRFTPYQERPARECGNDVLDFPKGSAPQSHGRKSVVRGLPGQNGLLLPCTNCREALVRPGSSRQAGRRTEQPVREIEGEPREIISSVKALKIPLAAISRGEIISSVKTLETPLAAISRGEVTAIAEKGVGHSCTTEKCAPLGLPG